MMNKPLAENIHRYPLVPEVFRAPVPQTTPAATAPYSLVATEYSGFGRPLVFLL